MINISEGIYEWFMFASEKILLDDLLFLKGWLITYFGDAKKKKKNPNWTSVGFY